MVTQITEGVRVSVQSVYQTEYSNAENEHFMFAYRVSIENMSNSVVQLLRREWTIFDSNGTTSEIKGEGVIGLQPHIASGETHEYVSGCNLQTEIGYMVGKYEMLREEDETTFYVDIPRFQLIAPYRLN